MAVIKEKNPLWSLKVTSRSRYKLFEFVLFKQGKKMTDSIWEAATNEYLITLRDKCLNWWFDNSSLWLFSVDQWIHKSTFHVSNNMCCSYNCKTPLCICVIFLFFLTASKAHQYAAATKRAWGHQWWARSPHVPFLPPYASPRSTTGQNAYGSAET